MYAPFDLRFAVMGVVSGQWSVVSGQWSVVSGQWSVVSGQWSVKRILQVHCDLRLKIVVWQGLKPPVLSTSFAARLKSCPDASWLSGLVISFATPDQDGDDKRGGAKAPGFFHVFCGTTNVVP